MTARRYDLTPEPVIVVVPVDEPRGIGTRNERRWEQGRVPAAGHLGIQEVGCDGHLIGEDGGYCLYCRAEV